MGRSIIDGTTVEEARSGEGLCSHASLDCLLNRIYFQVWLAFFVNVALHTALLSSYYRFPWNLFIGPLMLRDHFFAQHSLFLFLPPLENRTAAKEKEMQRTIHRFISQTQAHADTYQRKISLPTQLSSDFIRRAMQLDTPTRALFG